MKRIIALVLALTLLFACCATAGAASKKAGRTKVRGAAAVVYKDGFSLKYTWKKVSGATGYEYCYNLNQTGLSTKGDYTFATTNQTSAEIKLKAYGTVDFRVRAFTVFDGNKIYGPWAACRMKQSKVDRLIVRQVKKRMKTNNLFMKATVQTVNVRSKPAAKYDVLTQISSGDENRATGDFKRDKDGNWWIRVYASLSQTKTVKGWVISDEVQAVWY